MEIERLEPARCLDMRSIAGPFPMRVTYTFEDRDGGTVARNRVRGGALKPMGPLVRRSVQRDLNALRARLERND